ncbi:Bis(5'-adenosyl)-triphosphatase enpp4 [Sparganum proliferum]
MAIKFGERPIWRSTVETINSKVFVDIVKDAFGYNGIHRRRMDTVMLQDNAPVHRSKEIYSDSENLWVSAKNNGFNSASFYWPEDYLKVNGSSPLLSAGLLPSNGDITFYLDKITDWLSTPDVNFVSAYIPVPASENLQTNDIVQSANNVLAQLIQSVRKNKTLASVVNFVLLGGISPPKSSLNVSEVKVPVSPFRTYVSQGRAFEVWLSLPHRRRSLERDTSHFFSCSTRTFRERHPHLDIGVLPPLYLVAKPGYILRVRGLHDGEEGGAESDEAVDVDPSAFLLASGPQITTCSPPAAGAEAIQLTDIYSLVSWLLGIRRPSRHAGRLSRVSRLLRVPPTAMQLEQFERHAAGLPQPAGLALLRDPSTLAFGVSVILLAAVLAVVVSIFACMHRPDVCCCVCCLRGATRRRLARSRRWRKWKSTGQGGSALLGTANGDSRSSLEADEDDLNGNEEIVILEQRSRRGNSADFLNMLHGPLESGQSRTQIPHL